VKITVKEDFNENKSGESWIIIWKSKRSNE
jgi:hypothetical protein